MDSSSFYNRVIDYIFANNLYTDVALYVGIILGILIGYLMAVHFSPSYLHWREKCAKNKQERIDARKIKREDRKALKSRLKYFKKFVSDNKYKCNVDGFYYISEENEDSIYLCRECAKEGYINELETTDGGKINFRYIDNMEDIYCKKCGFFVDIKKFIKLSKNHPFMKNLRMRTD